MMQATHTHTRIYFLFLFPISIAEGATGGRKGSPPGLDASSSQGPIWAFQGFWGTLLKGTLVML